MKEAGPRGTGPSSADQYEARNLDRDFPRNVLKRSCDRLKKTDQINERKSEGAPQSSSPFQRVKRSVNHRSGGHRVLEGHKG